MIALRAPLTASLLPLLFAASSGCAGPSSLGGPSIPRGAGLEIRIENLNYDPPRIIGLVNEGHPRLDEVWVLGVKKVSREDMEQLLSVLEDRGFMAISGPGSGPLDRSAYVGRVAVTVDDAVYEYALPRRPSQEAVDQYNDLQRPVAELFDVTFSPRAGLGVGFRDLRQQQELLRRSNERKARAGRTRPWKRLRP